MTEQAPHLGAVYDVGGALAIYWPDTHPCHETEAFPPWLILHPEGDTERVAELSQGHLVDYLPGFEPQTIANTPPSPVTRAVGIGLFAGPPGPLGVSQPPPDAGYAAGVSAGYAAGYRHAKEGR